MKKRKIVQLLEEKAAEYEQPNFIANDPIGLPHRFEQKQDIEIMAFFAATLAWGQRITVINNCNRLAEWMGNRPYHFILNHSEEELIPFENFVHRTFNGTDTLYFLHFLKQHYSEHESLESAFSKFLSPKDPSVEKALIGFRDYFFSLPEAPARTKKHVATPARKSACKRLNMFLRWMVRPGAKGVDFGIWKEISPSQLVCPLDVHVERVARKLGLLKRKQTDWLAAIELTENLKKLDKSDPVKYDFALFGLGLEGFGKEYKCADCAS